MAQKSIDLILCFDDIISYGYRESVTTTQIESYIEMDSTDEKVFYKQQMIKEAEMKEHGKYQQREIAKKRLEAGYKRDKMEAISSADYEPKEPERDNTAEENKLTSMLNKQPGERATKKMPEKNSF